jgi:hypothetical protein
MAKLPRSPLEFRCDGPDVGALPALPDTVAAFLASEVERGIRPSTIGRRVAAIRYGRHGPAFGMNDDFVANPALRCAKDDDCSRLLAKQHGVECCTAPLVSGSFATDRARRKSVHVRNAPKATAGGQDVARRNGPLATFAPQKGSMPFRRGTIVEALHKPLSDRQSIARPELALM